MKKENSWIFADFVYSDGLELSLNTSCYANELPAAVEILVPGLNQMRALLESSHGRYLN